MPFIEPNLFCFIFIVVIVRAILVVLIMAAKEPALSIRAIEAGVYTADRTQGAECA